MTRNTAIYLRDILENMRLAEEFVGDMTVEALSADRKAAYAVLRCLEVMGEAAKNVPESLRGRHPGVPWKDMAGMRDRVIHMYFGVSHDKVWHTVKEVIPAVRPHVEQALRDVEQEAESTQSDTIKR